MHLPAFPIMTMFIAFILWTAIKRKSAEHADQKKTDAFWEREYAANQVRKQDISHLDYLKIDISALPLKNVSDDPLSSYEKDILELAKKPMLNLSGQTNTDLKMSYGAANLEFLSQCDQNYTTLIKTLFEWGKALYENGQIEDALAVLEYGIQCQTDISGHYTLLASIYQETGQDFKIQELIRHASQINSIMRDSILRSLETFVSSDQPSSSNSENTP